MEILQTLAGMDSTALVAAVLHQVRQPKFPARDKEGLKRSFNLHRLKLTYRSLATAETNIFISPAYAETNIYINLCTS